MKARFGILCIVLLIVVANARAHGEELAFPGEKWQVKRPAELGLNPAPLAEIAEMLGGRGCIVQNGYIVQSWGDLEERVDWMSSAKPVLSTLLFFALQEGLIESVDQRITDFGWDLRSNDYNIKFRHLGAMTSGYARPEGPGEAYAYNDFAIQLYQKTLFDKVFQSDPQEAAEHPHRLGALGLERGLRFRDRNRRMSASVLDFARIAWLWANRGKWGDRQLLPEHYFDDYCTPQVAPDLPHTQEKSTDDYLEIGTYGGGSDHFTRFGPGIYGFNWWFNDVGREHPQMPTWPDAPEDAFMSIGAGGNCSIIIPSESLILVCAKGDWGQLEPGRHDAKINGYFRLLKRTRTGN